MTGEIFSAESFLWSCLWQSTIFLVAGLFGSFLLRRHSARAHRVLFLAMIAAVIVPAASMLVKHYELGLFVGEPALIQAPIYDRAIYETTGIISNEAIESSPDPINEDSHSAMAVSGAAKFPWRSALIYAWIAASLILAARLLVTFVFGVRLLRRAMPLNNEKIEQAIHLAKAKLGISKDVKIYGSANIHSPVIWCWRRKPILLVPSAAGRSDNGIDWAGVLCHELAHYKRRDHIAGLLAELMVCLLPWHPLLWWAKSRLITLSEQACDDWVIASGRPGTDYAESLLNLTPEGQMAFVPAVVSSKRGLAGRVRRILKDRCGNPRTGAAWAVAVSITVVCMAVGIAFAQTRPVKSQVPGKREADELDQEQPDPRKLPVGWSLDYDDGLLAGGGRHWPGNMAKDLASLEIRLKPYDPFKASLKGEKYEFWIFSLEGEQMGNIRVWPETEMPVPSSKIFKSGKYVLKYRRRWGPSGDNFRMECGEYPINLSKPGMYELTFTPKIGTAEITGTLGGCYAINFEKIGNTPWIRGFAYQDPRLGKQYILDGLPPGKYLLSAVTMHESPNVFVSQTKVTVGTEDKAIVNIVPVPIGNCSLKGNILGEQKKYKTPWPDQWPESEGKWYVLIRKLGSDAVGSMEAYEALTMDSLYVIRSGSIVQQTQDRAQYHIEGLAPGQYTVTAIEHPSWGGCTVTRQLSKNLTLKAGEDAVLDFGLQIIPEHNYDTGAKADSEEAASLIKVTGLVKDPQGRPVSGASVTLFQTKLEYVTDAEGKFVASLAPSDKMRYFFAVHKQRKLVASGRLAGGKQHVEIELMPARMVSGRVLDPNGRPVSGAQVAPLPMTCFHVLTDSEGRFDVGWSPKWHAPDHELCLMVRHTELNLAAVVDIAPEDRTIDVKLEHALALHGTIEDTNGRPILGAVVGLSLIRGWGAGTPVRNVITDYQGRFKLSALPQRQEYAVTAEAEGYWRNGIKTGVINRVTRREEVGPIILKKPILSVSGTVVDGDGKAVANIPVYFRGAGQPRLDSQTDEQGRFRFEKVCSGPVQINSKNDTIFGTVETQGGAKDIRLVVGPRFGPRAAEEIESARPRIISFPESRSMGKLFARDAGPDNWYEGWQELGEANGDVSVAAGKEAKLQISERASGDLSALEKLGPDDLQMLSFGWKAVKVGSLAPIANLKGLKALNIQSAKFDSEDFKHLTGLAQLEVLRFGDQQLTDGSMRYIGQLTSLRSLALWGTGISDAGLKHLRGLTNLTFLALNSCEITDQGLNYLRNMTALEGLQIYQTKITDKGLEKLQGLDRLKHIKINGNGITDEGLKHLEDLTLLENIWLDSNPITDKGLSYLAGMKNLKELYAARTKITDAGLVNLKGMKDFHHLLIDGIGDEGIRHLSELPVLEMLQIQDAQITKASIPDFKKMMSIKQVLLSGDKINDDLLDALRTALPNCKIWDPQRSRDYPMAAWRQRFEAVYRLEDDQILKRISPPFIPERRDYYVNEESQQASFVSRSPDRFIFHWDRKLKKWGLGFINTPDIDSTLRGVLRLKSYEFEGPRELLDLNLPGDWIVRDEAPVAAKLAALQEVLANELERKIRFEKRTVEHEVIVATGRFSFHPLAEARKQDTVHLYVDELSSSGGGSVDSVAEFLQTVGNRVNTYVIDRTEPSEETRILYYLHRSSRTLRQMESGPEKAKKLKVFLENLSRQTDLQFEITRRPVEVWFVTEETEN